jgi:hypothetical protein
MEIAQMKIGSNLVCMAAASGLATLFVSMPAHALTMQECSAKYEAAKSAGTLDGKKWNDFRKAECSADATPASATTTTAAPAPPAAAPAPKAAEAKPAAPAKETAKPAAAPASAAVFPSAVAAKYASESAGKGRMHTCLDQYKANKATNANGGLEWIQKGGGYYSQCNTRLKG